MPLLHLPLELLALIAHHVGASELRKSVDNLLVAKRWYRAILPVYLFRLPLSNLYLASHHDLEILPSSNAPLSSLIQMKSKRLSVRLVGHPCRYPSIAPWHDNTTISRGQDGTKKVGDWHYDWTTIGPVEVLNGECPRRAWRWCGETRTLYRWADRVNRKLDKLAVMLPNVKNLDEFSLEAASEIDGEQGPRWDYLHDSTVCSLILSLPPFLNNLTIDLCGSTVITPDRGRDVFHLCPIVGDRLRDFQNVRLRLRCICPQVFQPLSKSKTEPRLKTLVIKLCLPFFPDVGPGTYEKLVASSCDVSAIPLHKRMITAAAESTKNFPRLSMMRVSFGNTLGQDTCLQVADCVRDRFMSDSIGIFSSDDDGSRWFAWESNETMQDLGSLEELLR